MNAQKKQNDKSPHILIMRLSAMGDVAIVPHVVRKLRQDFPDLRITILTRPAFRDFFRDIDNIDFLTPDFKKLHKGPAGLVRLYKEILDLDISHIADLHDVLRTKFLRTLFRLSGIEVAVIDKGREGKRALTRKYNKIVAQQEPSCERYRDTIRKLGFCMDEPEPPTHKAKPLSKEVKAIVGQKKGPWIGIAPFAKHAGKIYPTTLTGELIGMLTEKFGQVFIFGGGTYEKEYAECLEERHKGVTSLIGKLKLTEEMDLISNLNVMITMDSASMHIASLVGTPVVSVWGATHPFAGFYGFGQNPDNIIQIDLPCRPCSVFGDKPCMYNDYRCLHKIPPQTIYDKVSDVLKAGKPKKSGK